MNLFHPESPSVPCPLSSVQSRYLHLLAIHPISHTSMTRNTIPEILDIESPLDPTCEESSKGCNKRSERCHNKAMDLERRVRDGRDRPSNLSTSRMNRSVSTTAITCLLGYSQVIRQQLEQSQATRTISTKRSGWGNT
jgi:hypothetical protein